MVTVHRSNHGIDVNGKAAIAAILVILGAAAGATLFVLDPGLLILGLVGLGAVAAIAVAYYMPGLLFAAFLCTPFYKAGLQPYLPVDLTVVLALLNTVQIPLVFMNSANPGAQHLSKGRIRSSILLWLSFTALVVAGVVYAPEMDAAMRTATVWAVLTVPPAFAAVRIAQNPRYLSQFLWGLLLIGTTVVLAGLWLLPQVGEWPNDRLRVFGTHTIRVGQAALLVPLIVIPFVRRTNTGLIRLLFLLLIPAAFLVSASSGSRGPLVMLVVTAVFFVFRRLFNWALNRSKRPQTLRPLRFVIPGTFILLLLLVVPMQHMTSLLPEAAAARLGSIVTILSRVESMDVVENAPDTSTEGRLIAYEFAQEMFAEQPLIGHGTFSFATLSSRYEERLDWLPEDAHPHNLVLQVAAEFGILGLFVFAAVVGTALWRGLRVTGAHDWTTVSVLAVFFLLCAMVSTDMYDNRLLWSLLLLLLLAPESAYRPDDSPLDPPSTTNALAPTVRP